MTHRRFDGQIPGTNLVVDNFLDQHRKGTLLFFLTHCHTDHLIGLSDTFTEGKFTAELMFRPLLSVKSLVIAGNY